MRPPRGPERGPRRATIPSRRSSPSSRSTPPTPTPPGGASRARRSRSSSRASTARSHRRRRPDRQPPPGRPRPRDRAGDEADPAGRVIPARRSYAQTFPLDLASGRGRRRRLGPTQTVTESATSRFDAAAGVCPDGRRPRRQSRSADRDAPRARSRDRVRNCASASCTSRSSRRPSTSDVGDPSRAKTSATLPPAKRDRGAVRRSASSIVTGTTITPSPPRAPIGGSLHRPREATVSSKRARCARCSSRASTTKLSRHSCRRRARQRAAAPRGDRYVVRPAGAWSCSRRPRRASWWRRSCRVGRATAARARAARGRSLSVGTRLSVDLEQV
jgi:hypothetical protein